MKKQDEIRTINDLKDIVFDKSCLKDKNRLVYFVGRDRKRQGDLRYDQTLIKPELLGKEFPKTKGHEHPPACIELIKVVEGQGLFLLQKDEKDIISDIYFIKAKKGQCLVSPQGYSHTTINDSGKDLVIATWLDQHCQSDYSNIKELKGFGYFYTISGWQKNKHYKKIPKLREEKPLQMFPKNLNFLNAK